MKEKEMEKEFDIEMDEFREQLGEQYRRRKEDKKNYRSLLPSDFKLERRYVVFGAIGILVLIVVFILFSGGDNGAPREDVNTIRAKLDELENRLTELEGANQKIVRLENQIKKLDRSVSQLNRSLALKTGKGRYHVVRRGETLSVIAQKYGITINELCRLNRITPKSVIHPGQKIFITSGSKQ
jgi:LysM repeat protein